MKRIDLNTIEPISTTDLLDKLRMDEMRIINLAKMYAQTQDESINKTINLRMSMNKLTTETFLYATK
jgi:hypothetical protein